MLKFKIIAMLLALAPHYVGAQNILLKENENLKSQFLATKERVKTLSPQQEVVALANYRIILVPGLWTGDYSHYLSYLRPLGFDIPEGTLVSFADQLEWYQERGIDIQVAPIDTTADCETRASQLSAAIADSPKEVILMTHSTGGLDVLHSMVNDPALGAKVKGWISLQTPFLGTPLTAWPLAPSFFGGLQRFLIGMILGKTESLACVTHEFRQRYLEDHKVSIAEFVGGVKFISVGSWKNPSLSPWPKGGPMDAFISWIFVQPHGGPNDGLVPTQGSCLPDSPSACLILENMDHAGPVMDLPPFPSLGKEERIILTRTLMHLLLET